MEVSIRPLEERDVGALPPLLTELGYPSDEAQVRGRLRNLIEKDPDFQIFIAETAEGSAVGFVYVRICYHLLADPRAFIEGIVVEEAYHGKGLGGALLRFAERWALTRSCSELYLRSNVTREAAHRFYEGNGYTRSKTSYTFRKTLERNP